MLGYWLERRGLLALHASAVCVAGVAVAFAADLRGGKSSLAATFLERGDELLCDDVLVVERAGSGFRGLPAYPQMRLWPAEVERFVPGSVATRRVHPDVAKRLVPIGGPGFGRFHGQPAPLSRVFLPERQPGGALELTPVSPRDAVIEMVRRSFVPFLVEGAGLQPARLERLAQLAETVPMRRLRLPEGLSRLPAVREAVLRDLSAEPA